MNPVWIVILTVVGCAVYLFANWLLLEILDSLTSAYKRQDTFLSRLVVLLFLVPIAAICLVLDIIHSLLCIWLGYRAMTGLRDWWHKAH